MRCIDSKSLGRKRLRFSLFTLVGLAVLALTAVLVVCSIDGPWQPALSHYKSSRAWEREQGECGGNIQGIWYLAPDQPAVFSDITTSPHSLSEVRTKTDDATASMWRYPLFVVTDVRTWNKEAAVESPVVLAASGGHFYKGVEYLITIDGYGKRSTIERDRAQDILEKLTEVPRR